MTGQSRSLDAILRDRLKVIQDIAAANTEQLRLNQKASGMLVLDMKDTRDGVEEHAHEAERSRTEAALDRNMDEIRRLEERLSALDQELEATVANEVDG